VQGFLSDALGQKQTFAPQNAMSINRSVVSALGH
jgi:hypothetical protein